MAISEKELCSLKVRLKSIQAHAAGVQAVLEKFQHPLEEQTRLEVELAKARQKIAKAEEYLEAYYPGDDPEHVVAVLRHVLLDEDVNKPTELEWPEHKQPSVHNVKVEKVHDRKDNEE